jgi:hypothetical protein
MFSFQRPYFGCKFGSLDPVGNLENNFRDDMREGNVMGEASHQHQKGKSGVAGGMCV